MNLYHIAGVTYTLEYMVQIEYCFLSNKPQYTKWLPVDHFEDLKSDNSPYWWLLWFFPPEFLGIQPKYRRKNFISSVTEFNNHRFVRCQFQISQSHFYIFRRFFALDNFIFLDDFNDNHLHCQISPACSRASSWTVTKPKPKVILKSIGFISFPSRWIKIFSELNSRSGGKVYDHEK